MVPPWVTPEQFRELKPPAEVRALGDQRSAENLLAASKVLRVTEAKRYAPTAVTWCNIYTSDVCDILKAPLPHWYDLGDGKGRREMRANDMYDGLMANKFPGWSKVGTVASSLAVTNLVAVGVPVVAVWKNALGGPGHIMLVTPTPAGSTGVYVTGAGRLCREGCTLAQGFGSFAGAVHFFSYNR